MEKWEAKVGALVRISLITGAQRFGIITKVVGFPAPGYINVDWEDGQKGLLVWSRNCSNSAYQPDVVS